MFSKLLELLLSFLSKPTPKSNSTTGPATEVVMPQSPAVPGKSDPFRFFSRKEFLKGREAEYPLTDKLESNMVELLSRVNGIREAWNKPMSVTSGYRPGKYNEAAGGAKNSCHLTCEAIDIADPSGELAAFVQASGNELLNKFDLYMEHPSKTKGWVHLQTRKVSVRVFMP